MTTPRKLRIIGLGDSTTAGTPDFCSPIEVPPEGSGNPESQYAFWMMKVHPEWLVLNRGINGERSEQVASRFERDVLGEHPDYVVILAGVNDIYQGYPADHVERSLSSLYISAQEASIIPVAATVLPYNTLTKGAFETLRDVNLWIKTKAKSMGILFCDTYSAVADSHIPPRLRSSSDGLHPDVSGYRRMGEALACTIEAHLKKYKP